MSLTGECRQQKHAQHAPSTKMECDHLYVWINNKKHTQKKNKKQKKTKQTNKKKKKERSHTQKSYPKWWTPEI